MILATGGFDWNRELVDRFLPLRADEITRGTPPVLRGDGRLMAERVGASLHSTEEGWWWPVAHIPGETYEGQPLGRTVVFERTRRHSITVNRAGKRFANESMHHMAFEMFARDARGELVNNPAWVVFDRRYRKRNVVLTLLPVQPHPDRLMKADTLDALARTAGIDPIGLTATVERWNRLCSEGFDRDFGRGSTEYDRHHDEHGEALPNLGTIAEPPFYALPIQVSPVGTKGGPEIDATGRVVRMDKTAIPGLYAAGNVASRVLGPAIYGAGVTIASAVTFAYLGARHAADRAR